MNKFFSYEFILAKVIYLLTIYIWNSSFCPFDRILSGATTQGKSISGSNGNEVPVLRSYIHEYGHVQNRHVMFITIEYIKNRNLKNT